jgi:hypothetical protein
MLTSINDRKGFSYLEASGKEINAVREQQERFIEAQTNIARLAPKLPATPAAGAGALETAQP